MNAIQFLNNFIEGMKTPRLDYTPRKWNDSSNPVVNYYANNPTYGRRVPKTSISPIMQSLPEDIANRRASNEYSNWLASSNKFTLGGQNYKWVEAPVSLPSQAASLPAKNQSYQLGLQSLIEQKRRLSNNNNYIAVPV